MDLLNLLWAIPPLYLLSVLWFSDEEDKIWQSTLRPIISVPVCAFLLLVVACFWTGFGINAIRKKIV